MPRSPEPRHVPSLRLAGQALSWRDERGSAAIEFVTAAVVLVVPLVYLLIALARIQAVAYALDGGVQHAAALAAQQADHATANSAVEAALAVALAETPGAASVTVHCEPEPTDCTTRGGSIEVAAAMRVSLPLLDGPVRLPASEVQLVASAARPVSSFLAVP